VRHEAFVLVTALVAVVLACDVGAGIDPGGVSGGRCLKVPQPLVSSLKSGLKRAARGKFGVAAAVRSRGKFGGLRDIREGPVYFVSARVRGFGIATWAVGGSAFKTGGGVILGVGPVARRISTFGVDIPTSTLAGWGLAPYAEGYDVSQTCVR
jgi:hypothetical protein